MYNKSIKKDIENELEREIDDMTKALTKCTCENVFAMAKRTFQHVVLCAFVEISEHLKHWQWHW